MGQTAPTWILSGSCEALMQGKFRTLIQKRNAMFCITIYRAWKLPKKVCVKMSSWRRVWGRKGAARKGKLPQSTSDFSGGWLHSVACRIPGHSFRQWCSPGQ
eukprot:1159216-Pelagomonas_calceolata.AAC.4